MGAARARPDFPPAWLSWQELELTDQEAKALQRELIEVVQHLEQKLRPGPSRRRYLVHVGLAPALEDAQARTVRSNPAPRTPQDANGSRTTTPSKR